MSFGKELYKEGSRITGIGVIGAYLAILYPILIWFVLGTLSGHGFQDKVRRKLDDNNQSLTIPFVVRQADQLIKIEEHGNALKEQLQNSDKKIENLNRNVIIKEKEANAEHKDIGSLNLKIIKILGQLEIEKTGEKKKAGNLTFAQRVHPHLENSEPLKKLWLEYQRKNARLFNLEEEVESWYRKRDQEFKIKDNIESSIKSANTSSIKVLEQHNAGDIISELEFMNKFLFRGFATMPGHLLILLLTLSMGALGSLLYITQHFFNPDLDKPFSWYLFRPFLGMVTAFSIFILAKAGQITISDTNASEGILENLNPFFISFLAIISGLLSEQAIEKIKRSAMPFFQPQKDENDEVERWAVGLESAMKEQGKTAQNLLPFVNASDKTIEEWISETNQVPEEAQRIIAGWLNLPTRMLFTDLPPTQNSGDRE